MGAHKHNPTAIAAANGELPPKTPQKSQKEIDRELDVLVRAAMMQVCPEAYTMCMALGRPYISEMRR